MYWADNGKGKLEKRTVELGEYDEGMDLYEITSGLELTDSIAWPDIWIPYRFKDNYKCRMKHGGRISG